MVYIDTNMVRAGAASHPSQWTFGGYNQIQAPRKKNILIDHERLQGLLGVNSHDEVRICQKKWVESYLAAGQFSRQEEWTQSIAVGRRAYVERVKELLGFRAKGREIGDRVEGCQLREPAARYGRFFEIKNDDMGPENTFDWRQNTT